MILKILNGLISIVSLHHQNQRTMKTFVAVTQISATQFDVEKINAETQSRVRTKGILITCWESNKQNDEYCFYLAELMTEELKNQRQ